MIGVDMREQNRADIGPLDAHAFPRAVERVEAGLRIHAGIDEHPAIGKPDEVDVDQAEGKRKRQFQDVDARKHLPVIPADLQVGGQCADCTILGAGCESLESLCLLRALIKASGKQNWLSGSKTRLVGWQIKGQVARHRLRELLHECLAGFLQNPGTPCWFSELSEIGLPLDKKRQVRDLPYKEKEGQARDLPRQSTESESGTAGRRRGCRRG